MDGTDGDEARSPEVPDPAEPAAPPVAAAAPGRSRRWFVAGGVALVAGAGAGVAAGLARGTSHSVAPTSIPAPLRTQLAAVLADERRLVALARHAHRDGADPVVAAALLRDHEAHLAALTAAVRELAPGAVRASPRATGTSRAPQQVPDRTGLRDAERLAARRAAHRAARMAGHRETVTVAVLLAGIAACESTHVELLHG